MVKLRRDIRSMRKISFIFSSKLKVKHYCLFQENPIYNINLFVLQEYGKFVELCLTCEELVGDNHRG